MAGQERAKLFGDDDFNPDDWPIEDKPKRPRPDPVETAQAAERAGFRHRDVAKPAAPVPAVAEKVASIVPNRRRTGRTDQLGIRTTTETKEKFKSLAAAMGWSEAVAFEKAVELMSQHYKASTNQS